MRIALVTQWFPPEKAYIPADVAVALAERGHEVTVITGFPNYPHGRIYEGWRQRPWSDFDAGRYWVRRVALYPSHSASAVRRFAAYLSFAITSTIFGWRILRRADAVYVYHPPLTAALGPWLSRSFGGSRYVLHIQDVWPDSVLHSGLVATSEGGILAKFMHFACRAVYARSDAVAAIAPSMSQLLIERGHPSDRVEVVANWADEDVFFPGGGHSAGADRPNPNDNFTVMFAGNMGDIQALDVAIRAASKVTDLRGFELVLVGEGVARRKLQEQAAALGLNNVAFLPPQPFEAMNGVMHGADVQLVSLRDLPFLRATIPSKLAAAMAAGLPVICAVGGDANGIVDAAGAGWTCDPEDDEQLADAFRSAYAARADLPRRGLAARVYYDEFLSRARGVRALARIITGEECDLA